MSQTTQFIYGTTLAVICCCANPLSAQITPTFSSAEIKPFLASAVLPTSAPFSTSNTEPLPDAPEPTSSTGDASPIEGKPDSGSGASSIYTFPDAHQRFKSYLASAFGPGSFVAAGIASGVDQAHPLKVGYPADGFNAPGKHPAHGAVPEWSEGFDGYAKRYASRYGEHLVSATAFYGLGVLLHEDVTYHRCECSGIVRRSSHALTQTFIAHTTSGKALPSLPALVAPFVGAEVGVAGWFPARYGVSDALRQSEDLYIGLPIQNFVKEFLRR